ncbi:MAG: type II secretion system F family protein [Leptospirales bacterium]
MPVYAYQGVQENGARTSGLVDADSPRTARQKLKSQGVLPLTLTLREDASQSRRFGTGKKARQRDVALVTRQLSILVGSGIPVVDSLGAVLDQGLIEPLGSTVAAIREDVKEGQPLHQALSLHPRVFSELYINMIRAGEESGTLDVMLERLADFLESQVQTQRKVLGSLFYPLILMVVGILMVFFLLVVVMPRITSIFNGLHAGLPLPTIILMGASDWVRHETVPLLISFMAILLLTARWVRANRKKVDGMVLRIPRLGVLIVQDQIARFGRTLSVLLKGGVPLQRALEIGTAVLTNQALKEAVIFAREEVKNGESLGQSLKRYPIIPRLAIHMIQTGERSGKLEELLLKMAQGYEAEVSQMVTTMTSIIEPIMILFIGAIVLFMVLAVLLPIFEMSQAVE